MKVSFIVALSMFISLNMFSQEHGWHLGEADKSGAVGISAQGLYSTLLNGMTGNEVVVAVIDSGIDVEHEDLKDNIWVNIDEIPDNGIDDDNNGYIDDVYGWNFIGGPDGNVNDETLEVTRLYAKYRYKFKDAIRSQLAKSDLEDYDLFIKCKEEVESSRTKATERLEQSKQSKERVGKALDRLTEVLDGKEAKLASIENLDTTDDESLALGKNIAMDQLTRGDSLVNLDELRTGIYEDLDARIKYFGGQAEFMYNPDFESRGIVGDDYSNQTEKYYGNNDVEGPDALHGTHVAGIIGAVRNNDIGMDGVAENVKLMSVRTVPNGDERDKDVANAIIYAVDNGASIINMSFGKGFSWNEKIVEDAILYAEKNDVLLVHAAGNSAQNNDTTDNFPNDIYMKKGFLGIFKPKKKTFKNWLEIGALNYENGEKLSAPFSNYGYQNVDLFAPGMKIYSTLPDDKYKPLQGTSMAAPVVAGIAAVLRSYYPSLTAVQVKQILMATVTRMDNTVIVPGTADEKLPFSHLSVSGGVVNAEKAVKLAKKIKGKKKIATPKKGRA